MEPVISMAGLGEVLWVDDRSMADLAAIRAGLNAVAYVDPHRFRRNLVLRGMIETNIGGHQVKRQ
jgi:FMN phosphatase YigB (HAD superfamily)